MDLDALVKKLDAKLEEIKEAEKSEPAKTTSTRKVINLNEEMERLFSKEYMDDNRETIDKFISNIKNTKSFILKEQDGDYLNYILAKKNDKDYKLESAKINDNEIEIPFLFKDLWDKILKQAPKNITKIGLPLGDLDVKELKKFPNLDTLVITGYYHMKPETLEYIYKNTKIKNIEMRHVPYEIDLYNFDNYVCDENTMFYKDITLTSINKELFKNESVINCKTLDFNKIDKFINKDRNIKKYTITPDGDNFYEIKINDNNVDVYFKDVNINNVDDFYNFLIKKGFNVNSITMNLYLFKHDSSEEKVKYTDFDYSKIDKLNEKTKIIIAYDGYSNCDYSEFKGLVESVKWYKKIITDYDLSPLEKLLFAYDIMKTFPYNENENDKADAREPHRIIETGHIVCVGYVKLLNEILEDLDPNIKFGNFGCTCYENDDVTVRGFHDRGMVRIDDDKYNVHGAYVIDPTWDSVKDDEKKYYGEDYDALTIYQHFLIPFIDYKKVFKHDSKPRLFDGKLETLNEDISRDNIEKQIKEIEKSETPKEGELPFKNKKEKMFNYEMGDFLDGVNDIKNKLRVFDGKKISFDKFLSVIRNVRIAEGYSGKLLEDSVNKVARCNAGYYGVKDTNEYTR